MVAHLNHGRSNSDIPSFFPDNEKAVGKAIRESGIPREEIFVTTKFIRQANVAPKATLEASLKSLGLEYVDLWLLHWPMAQIDGRLISPISHRCIFF